MIRGPYPQKLCNIDYEDTVQSILDRYGVDLIVLRKPRRARGIVLDAKIHLARALRRIGVTSYNIGRILNCSEWTATYLANSTMRDLKKDRDLRRYHQRKTSPLHPQPKGSPAVLRPESGERNTLSIG